jgi:hypothetical protein
LLEVPQRLSGGPLRERLGAFFSIRGKGVENRDK